MSIFIQRVAVCDIILYVCYDIIVPKINGKHNEQQ